MPAGRPTLYRDEYCDEVIELGKQGKSRTQIAVALGVTRATLIEWSNVHPEFSTAITRAMESSQDWWENAAQVGLTADKFNAHVWSTSVKARFKDDYTEKSAVDVTSGGEPIALEPLDVARRVAFLLTSGAKAAEK